MRYQETVISLGLLVTLQISHFYLLVRLGLPLAFQARDSPRKMDGGRVCAPKGNATNLDPKRVSEAFQEERVLVPRLCRGPVKPQNDQWGSDREPRSTTHCPGGETEAPSGQGLAYIPGDPTSWYGEK